MRKQGLTLWRSKRKGHPRGNLRASWRDEAGKRVTWDTGTLDAPEALRKASAEVGRRRTPALSSGDSAGGSSHHNGTPPAASSGPAPAASPFSPTMDAAAAVNGRRPIGDAITRALANGEAAAAAAEVDALRAPAAELAGEAKAKAKKLYEVFGKAMAMLTAGGLQRACRYAGREPEEMDDDEEQLVREGWEEKGAEWFGRTDIGPWGKIALGSAVAGVGMYVGGKPIPPPAKLKLIPAEPAREPPPPETERR
jgi:hypothetical protein